MPITSQRETAGRAAIAPLKIGYADGSGLDTLTITDAMDQPVVWGRTGLDPEVSGAVNEFVAAKIIHRFNNHDGLVEALKAARNELMMLGDPGSTAEDVVDQIDRALSRAGEVER